MTRITGAVHEDQYTFMAISRSIFLRIRNFSDKYRRQIKGNFLCAICFFF